MKKMNKGFTLMEMLIVIAIIAILIAIAIPTFNAALEKSRQRTDLANARSLKSLVIADFMGDSNASTGWVASRLTDANANVFYIKEGGQDMLDSTTGNIKVQAKWDGESYTKGADVSCTFNNVCEIKGSVPALPDIPS